MTYSDGSVLSGFMEIIPTMTAEWVDKRHSQDGGFLSNE